MSQNLNLLRQNYCRPATVPSKRTLFPLEKQCEEGQTLLAKAPTTLLHLQKFSPSGLYQTYRDSATGADLPVFAVFDLKGEHRVTYEITTDALPALTRSYGLPAYLPFQKTQNYVRKINERRAKAERVTAGISSVTGFFPVLAYLFFHITMLAGPAASLLILGGWAADAFLFYLLRVFVLDRICPWNKLVITAEFDGILPREAREKARTAGDHFDKLYLIVDQQHRWKSALLPDPRPRSLDPLLIGELTRNGRHEFFLIDQFDLTEAEQYIADEFATTPDSVN